MAIRQIRISTSTASARSPVSTRSTGPTRSLNLGLAVRAREDAARSISDLGRGMFGLGRGIERLAERQDQEAADKFINDNVISPSQGMVNIVDDNGMQVKQSASAEKMNLNKYYERVGLAAKGSADEWLEATKKSVMEKMTSLTPRQREIAMKKMETFVRGNHENLMRFEAREVKRSRINKLDLDIDNRSNALANDICAQAGSEEKEYQANIADIETAYGERIRSIEAFDKESYKPEEIAKYREDAEEFKKKAIAEQVAIKEEHIRTHLMQMLAMIDLSEPMIDNAVADGLFDETSGAIRKQKAARYAVGNTINALITSGSVDVADAFISALEKPREDKNGKSEPSPIAQQYGFSPNDIAQMREYSNRRRTAINDEVKKEKIMSIEDEIANERMIVLDPTTIGNSTLNVSEFRKRLDRTSGIDAKTKARMVSEVSSIVGYREKYEADKAKYEAAELANDEKAKAAAGFITTDVKGNAIFNPASAFPKDTDAETYARFNLDSAVWSDLDNARIELEAAKMTGMMSRSFYESRLTHLRTLQNSETRQAWLKIYPELQALQNAGYGLSDPSSSQKTYRKKHNVPEAIWSKNKTAGSPTDWVVDSLDHNDRKEGESEEIIPLELMTKLEQTVQRLAMNGVDPTEAIRQMIAPTIQRGIRTNLAERLQDEDFFNAIVGRTMLETGYANKLGTEVEKNIARKGQSKRIQDDAGKSTKTNEEDEK